MCVRFGHSKIGQSARAQQLASFWKQSIPARRSNLQPLLQSREIVILLARYLGWEKRQQVGHPPSHGFCHHFYSLGIITFPSSAQQKHTHTHIHAMADENASEDAPITFNVKSNNDTKYTITISLSATVADLKEKLSTKEFADLPVERQRLIYSGRVLKDAETLASYKIQPGNTVHLVKGAASNVRQNPANQGTAATPALPTNLSAGTGNNPLAGLTGARYAGFAQLPSQDMFGPDGGVSVLYSSLTIMLTLFLPDGPAARSRRYGSNAAKSSVCVCAERSTLQSSTCREYDSTEPLTTRYGSSNATNAPISRVPPNDD